MQIRLRNVLAIGALTSGLLAGGALVADAATTSSTTGNSGTSSTTSRDPVLELETPGTPGRAAPARVRRARRPARAPVRPAPAPVPAPPATAPTWAAARGPHRSTSGRHGDPTVRSELEHGHPPAQPPRRPDPPDPDPTDHPTEEGRCGPRRQAARSARLSVLGHPRATPLGLRPSPPGRRARTPPARPARRRCAPPPRRARAATCGRPASRSAPGRDTRTPSR